MKKILSTIPAALSVVFLAGAFSPAQAVPMSVAKGITDNISTSAFTVTKVGKRGRGYHRGHRYRNRGYRRSRGYSRRRFDFSIGIGSSYPSYYSGRRSFYSPYNYDGYRRGYEYEREYQYRGNSKAAERIFEEQERDGN